jgi:osmotically-inducible protein OsmY
MTTFSRSLLISLALLILPGCGTVTRELEQTNYEVARVNTRVKAALIDSASIAAAAIRVEANVQERQLTLSGFVDSQAQAAEATRLAQQAATDYRIIDELTIR